MLVLMAGLPGTGKSTLARELAQRTDGHVLDKDDIREALFGPDHVEYSTAQDEVVVRLMLESAAWLLQKKPGLRIFLDGRVFSRSAQIKDVAEFAERVGTPWRIIECVCSEQTARRRLEQDSANGAHVAENRDFALYQEVKRRFQPICHEKTVVDTDQPIALCVERALQAIV